MFDNKFRQGDKRTKSNKKKWGYKVIFFLLMGISLFALSKIVSYTVANWQKEPISQDMQKRIDQESTAEARYVTESFKARSINLTYTAISVLDAATDTAIVLTQTARASSVAATQKSYYATSTILARSQTLPPLLPTNTSLPMSGGGGVSAKELAELETEGLENGRYLFNPPNEMVVDDKFRIELRIVRDSSVDNILFLQATMSANLQGQGTPQVESLQVGNLMTAKLAGSDFEIISYNEEKQVILNKSYAQWAWDVIPKKSGILDLNLTISVKVIFSDDVGQSDYPVITKKVNVRVNPAYSVATFLEGNWQWLLGTIIIPVLLWMWKKVNEHKTGEKRQKLIRGIKLISKFLQ